MFNGKYIAIAISAIIVAGCGGAQQTIEKANISSNADLKALNVHSLPYSNTPVLITSQIEKSNTLLPPPSSIGGKYIDRSYCSTKKDAMVVIAHADDDRYFMGDQVRNELLQGNCIKVLQINAGFDTDELSSAVEYNPADPYYYQGRIDGAVATYARLLSKNYKNPIYLTHAWDSVNNQLINRFILSTMVNGNNPSGQTIEIQVLGLPNSSNSYPISKAGVVTSQLYSNSTATSINIASKINGYNVPNTYTWSNMQTLVNQFLSWLNPYKVYSLDPFGIPNDDQQEGQHPDHIMAARLVHFSDFAKNNPSSIKYFKTYNVNTFSPNLSASVASDTEADLNEHWRFDWGSNFIVANPCDTSSSNQSKPESWACKQYTATPNEYFVARNIVDANGLCLNATGLANLSFGSCGVNSLQVTIGKSNLAWVSNNSTVATGASSTFVLYPSSLSASATIGLANYTSVSTDSKWHYNDDINKLEFSFKDQAGQLNKACLSKDSNGKAILGNCASAISITPSAMETKAAGSLKLKNAKTNTCLGLSNTGVSLVSCTDPKANLALDSNQNIKSNDGLYCLNAPKFATGDALTSQQCSSGSPGQKFAIQKISNSSRFVIRPNLDNMCIENDLKTWQCHGYEQQNWIVN